MTAYARFLLTIFLSFALTCLGHAEDKTGEWNPDWVNRPIQNSVDSGEKFIRQMPSQALGDHEVSILQISLMPGTGDHKSVRYAEFLPDLRVLKGDPENLVVIGKPARLKEFLAPLIEDKLVNVARSGFLVDSSRLRLPSMTVGEDVIFLDEQNFTKHQSRLIEPGIAQIYFPASNRRSVRIPAETWGAYYRTSLRAKRPWPSAVRHNFGDVDFPTLQALSKNLRERPIELGTDSIAVVVADMAFLVFAQRLPEFSVRPLKFPYRLLSFQEVAALVGEPSVEGDPIPLFTKETAPKTTRRIYDPNRRINGEAATAKVPSGERNILMSRFYKKETQQEFLTPSVPNSIRESEPFVIISHRVNQPRAILAFALLVNAKYLRSQTLDTIKASFETLMKNPWPPEHSAAITGFLEGEISFPEKTPKLVISEAQRSKREGCLHELTYVRKDSDLENGYVIIPLEGMSQ